MKINEIYSALEFSQFKDYRSFTDAEKIEIRKALKTNPRMLLHCKIPQEKMAEIVENLDFSPEEKFDFACDLVKFRVLKKTAAGFAQMTKFQEKFDDLKAERFKNLINEMPAQNQRALADEKYINDIVFDLRKNYDDGRLQQESNWQDAFAKLNEGQNLAYLPTLLREVFTPESNMSEQEKKSAQEFEATLIFNCVIAKNLQKEELGDEEILKQISQQNNLIGTKIFRLKSSEKSKKRLEQGTIFDFFNENSIELDMASSSASEASSPSKSSEGGSPQKFAFSAAASASPAAGASFDFDPKRVVESALSTLEMLSFSGAEAVSSAVKGRTRSGSQRQQFTANPNKPDLPSGDGLSGAEVFEVNTKPPRPKSPA